MPCGMMVSPTVMPAIWGHCYRMSSAFFLSTGIIDTVPRRFCYRQVTTLLRHLPKKVFTYIGKVQQIKRQVSLCRRKDEDMLIPGPNFHTGVQNFVPGSKNSYQGTKNHTFIPAYIGPNFKPGSKLHTWV
jgi:hypothetical protein